MNKQNFIYFPSKKIGSKIKARLDLTQLFQFAAKNKKGHDVVDIFICSRKKKIKNNEFIAWTEFESDNTNEVNTILNEEDSSQNSN